MKLKFFNQFCILICLLFYQLIGRTDSVIAGFFLLVFSLFVMSIQIALLALFWKKVLGWVLDKPFFYCILVAIANINITLA